MGLVVVGLGNAGVNLSEPQYRYWSAGGCDWRVGVRNCQFVHDRTLTALGFDGVENTDWKNEYKAGPVA